MRILLLNIFVLLAIPLFGQHIKGQIVQADGKAVPFASVVLLDSIGKVLEGQTSEPDGRFKIKYTDHRGKATIQISFIGYATLNQAILLTGKEITAGKITLQQESEKLAGAQVNATAVRSVLKGDTTELNADAFKVNPDATAQDLIGKMPGMNAQGGKLEAQGEEVTKILVDGKEYFGTNVATALRNLPADLISKIQVFDEQSEQSKFTGFKDGNTTKAINIITKRGLLKSLTGTFTAGAGTTDKYNLDANVNSIEGDRRITAYANSNNTNNETGRNTRHALGSNFNTVWNKDIKFSGNYGYNKGKSENESQSTRTYISEQTAGQVYLQQTANNNKTHGHDLRFKLDYRIDSLNSILIKPEFNTNSTIGTSWLNSQLYHQELPSNINSNQYQNNSDGWSFSNEILYRHKFNRQRSITLGFDQEVNKQDGVNDQQSNYQYNNRSDSLFSQQSISHQNDWGLVGNVSMTQTLSRFSVLMGSYGVSYSYNNSDKKTSELDTLSQIHVLNTQLSNVFTSSRFTQTGGVSFRYNKKELQINTRIDFQHRQLRNEQVFPYNHQLDKNYQSLLPSTRIRYRFSKTDVLTFNYRTSVGMPSIGQLQNVVNNNNPLRLRTGNPSLSPNYQYIVYARYNLSTSTGNSFYVNLSGRVSNSYITNNTFIATQDTIIEVGGNTIAMTKNAQLTSPTNISGFYTLSTNGSYGFPLKALKSNLNLNFSASYTQTPGLANQVKNYIYQPNFGGGVVLSSNISPNIDFTFRSNLSYNISRHSVTTQSNNNFYNLGNSFRANVILLSRIVLYSDIKHTLYAGKLNPNQQYLLWNSSVGYKIFKDKLGEIKLSVFDLLKQNQSYERNSTNLYNEEVNSQTLTQYFMLSFIYKLKRIN